MSDERNLSEDLDPAVSERATKERRAAEHQAFADKLAKRSPPDPVERAQIEKARKRTKARAPRIAMHVEDRETAGSVVYPAHSDEEGHMYRLADAFGTRSRQFVYSMLNGLGKATEDHSLDCDFSPGSPNQLKFNAALAVIDGVRPQDEIDGGNCSLHSAARQPRGRSRRGRSSRRWLLRLWCRAARQAHREHRALAPLARHRYVAAHHARKLQGARPVHVTSQHVRIGRRLSRVRFSQQRSTTNVCLNNTSVRFM